MVFGMRLCEAYVTVVVGGGGGGGRVWVCCEPAQLVMIVRMRVLD